MIAMIAAPAVVPTTLPRPPCRLPPPIITAAITSSSRPSATVGSPTDSFDVTTNGGGATDYQLQITIMLDDAQHTQGSVNGDGSITAFEGAVYSVQITEDQQGNLVATLSPEEGQGT